MKKLFSVLVFIAIFTMVLPQTFANYSDNTIIPDFSAGIFTQTYYINHSIQNLFWINTGSWTSKIYNLTDFYIYGWETIWNGLGSLSGTFWVQFEQTGWNPLAIDPLNATINTPLNGEWSFYFEFELNDGVENTILYQFSLFVYSDVFIPSFLWSLSFYIIIVLILMIAILGFIYLKRERYI